MLLSKKANIFVTARSICGPPVHVKNAGSTTESLVPVAGINTYFVYAICKISSGIEFYLFRCHR
jgi:hypothetical protein